MSHLKLKLNNKIILIFLLIVISFFRSPYIFLKGRFMAEDGELFFKSAFENNFLELCSISPQIRVIIIL